LGGYERRVMSQCTIYILPTARKEITGLPGNMRQRVKRAIDSLAENPRPHKSKALDFSDMDKELRRLRLDRWRIVYAITEDDIIKAIDILTVRKRPPYNYSNLIDLVKQLT